MTTLREAAQQALEALENGRRVRACEGGTKYQPPLEDSAIAVLRAALEEQEQEPRWLTKELMADYLDMIAEAIENNRSETLLHKAHWMRNRGEV